MEQQQVCS